MGGGIQLVFLRTYGMKTPLGEVQGLLMMRKPPINHMAKFDIGLNVDVPGIPLFEIANGHEGMIYPMLL